MLSTADTDTPHVTYVPHRHCFAVWHSNRTAPLSGETTPIDLAVPDEHGRVTVRTIGA